MVLHGAELRLFQDQALAQFVQSGAEVVRLFSREERKQFRAAIQNPQSTYYIAVYTLCGRTEVAHLFVHHLLECIESADEREQRETPMP